MGGLFGSSETTYVEGNRISEFQINSSTYGEAVPVILGTTRISGNVIDWADFKEHEHTSTQKHGKGGGSQTTVTTTYTYTVKAVIGLCEGEIADVLRVWQNKEITTLSGAGLNLFKGADGQSPWTGLQNYEDGSHYLPYNRLAYVAGEIDLGNSGSLPTYNFEVKGLLTETGDGIDANPADVIEYIVTNNLNGLGFEPGSIDADSLEDYCLYCRAADLYISLPPDVQDTDAVNLISDIFTATNAIAIWSDMKLKIIPLAEESISGNGVTWTCNMTPLFDLTDDDFCPSGDDPAVSFERADNSECYNEVSIEFYNRDNAYEKEVVKYQVMGDISRRGLIPASKKSLYFIHTKARAMYVAERMAVQSVYVRNKYSFRLDWSYGLLEPGDLVTISNEKLGLNKTLVRITDIEEDSEGMLSVTAQTVKTGAATATVYPADPERPTINTNVAPGNIETPEIFELPYQTNQREIGIAICGILPKWGGAQVWMSFDNTAYEYAGEVWAASRYGSITTGMTEAGSTVSVELVNPRGQILNATQESAQAGATISLIGNEWVTYQEAQLIGASCYSLSGMTRGLYGVQPSSHVTGERFVLVDNAIFKHSFRVEDTGRKVYIKFLSFNVYGSNLQSLDEVDAYEYTIVGPTPVFAPSNLAAVGALRAVKISWDAPDGNADVTGYEVWASYDGDSITEAVMAGETRDLSFYHAGLSVMQTVWYWVRAYDYGHNYGPYAGPVSATTKALDMEDIPEASIDESKLLPGLAQKIDSIDEINAAIPPIVAKIDNIGTVTIPAILGRLENVDMAAVPALLNALSLDQTMEQGAAAERVLSTKVDEGLAAEATERLKLTARVNDTMAAVTEESTVRVEKDNALSERITTIGAQIDETAAVIEEETNARVEGDAALSQQIATISAKADENAAVIQEETTARAEGDAALTERITTLSAQTSDSISAIQQSMTADTGNGVSVVLAAVSQDKTLESQAVAERTLNTKIDVGLAMEASERLTFVAQLKDTMAAVQEETRVRVEKDDALSERITTIGTQIDETAAVIEEETTARVEGDAALSQQIATVSAKADENAAVIQEETTARAEGDAALIDRITTLSAQTSDSISAIQQSMTADTGNGVSVVLAAVSQDKTLESQAIAERTLTVKQNELAAEQLLLAIKQDDAQAVLQSVNQIVNGPNGLVAQNYIKTDVNGNVAGYGLYNDGKVSEFAILANRFFIAKADGTITPVFEINTETGLAQLIGDLIASGSFTGREFNAAAQINLGAGGALVAGAGAIVQIGTAGDGAAMLLDSSTGRIVIRDPNNLTTGNYVDITTGDITTHQYIAGAYRAMKSLRKMEVGVGENGATVTLPGYWPSQPKIQVSPNALQCYDASYPNQSQQLRCYADAITYNNGIVTFVPRAYLEIAAGSNYVGLPVPVVSKKILQDSEFSEITTDNYLSVPTGAQNIVITAKVYAQRMAGYSSGSINWGGGYINGYNLKVTVRASLNGISYTLGTVDIPAALNDITNEPTSLYKTVTYTIPSGSGTLNLTATPTLGSTVRLASFDYDENSYWWSLYSKSSYLWLRLDSIQWGLSGSTQLAEGTLNYVAIAG